MLYSYEDAFIIDSISTDELEKAENDALIEIEKLGIVDDFFKEKLVKFLVYQKLALLQLENEEMKEKFNYYKREFNDYYKKAKAAQGSSIFVGNLARG